MRCHPPVPLNSRVANTDTTLPRGGGPDGKSPLFVPKGGVLTWNVYAYHRQKDVWGDDAEEFRPERWLGEEGRSIARQGWVYLPFNGGPRVCLGQQYALTEAGYVTARVCQEFKNIECRHESKEWREVISLVVSNRGGATVSLTPRD